MKTGDIKRGCDVLDDIRSAKKFVQNKGFDIDLSFHLGNLDSTSAEEVKQAILKVLEQREQSVVSEIKEKVNL